LGTRSVTRLPVRMRDENVPPAPCSYVLLSDMFSSCVRPKRGLRRSVCRTDCWLLRPRSDPAICAKSKGQRFSYGSGARHESRRSSFPSIFLRRRVGFFHGRGPRVAEPTSESASMTEPATARPNSGDGAALAATVDGPVSGIGCNWRSAAATRTDPIDPERSTRRRNLPLYKRHRLRPTILCCASPTASSVVHVREGLWQSSRHGLHSVLHVP